jgi:hypothetical protein
MEHTRLAGLGLQSFSSELKKEPGKAEAIASVPTDFFLPSVRDGCKLSKFLAKMLPSEFCAASA